MKYLVLLCVFIGLPSLAASDYKIEHLEPMHWWVGMKHKELQLMVHGEGIAELDVSAVYPGVTLKSLEKSDNPNYLFINFEVAPSAKAGVVPLVFSLNGKMQLKRDFRLAERRENSAQRRSFSAKDAVYLLTPDRFANGDSRNDSRVDMAEKVNRASPIGRHGGDIKGIEQHLDYIASMGFTMLWPTPLIENNQAVYSYHGYSQTNLYRIDPRMGSNESYKHMVAVAKQKNIGVIKDIVLNHIGTGHWWMQDLPAKDWLNNQAGFVATNNQHTTVLDIHAAADDINRFADGWFVDSMPDLNQRNPWLARYLIQNTVWWIEYANLAGVREDTYAYSDKQFLADWGNYLLEEYPALNIVGEEMNSNPHILAYWQKGVKNRDGYESSLPSLMDFPVVFLMPEVLTADESPSAGFIKLYEMIANDFVYADPMKLMVFPDNHDMSRIYALVHKNIELVKTSLLFTASTRGIAQYYYGTEILMDSPYVRDDGLLRADMPGGWPADKVNAFTGQGLSNEQRDLQGYLKTLLNWRKTSSAVAEGSLTHFIPTDGHYVYFRQSSTQTLIVVLNKNKGSSSLDLSRFKSILKANKSGKNIITGVSLDLTTTLQLEPMTSIAIEF